jgi:hypothetical protein
MKFQMMVRERSVKKYKIGRDQVSDTDRLLDHVIISEPVSENSVDIEEGINPFDTSIEDKEVINKTSITELDIIIDTRRHALMELYNV